MRNLLWIMLGLVVASGTAAAKTVTVEVGHDAEEASTAYLTFVPATLVVNVGDSVTWQAASHTPHTVTEMKEGAGGFDSSPALNREDPEVQAVFASWFGPGGFLQPGQSFNHTFPTAGTYEYHCKIHPGMQGKVVVASGGATGTVYVDAGSGSGQVTIDRYTPAEVTVEPGTMVVWTNAHSAEPHTVTDMAPDPMAPPGPSNPVEFDSSPNVGPPPEWLMGEDGVLAKDGANDAFTHTFSEAGTYTYFCKLHEAMVGNVIVLDDGTTGAGSGTTKTTPGLGLALLIAGVGLVAFARRRRGA